MTDEEADVLDLTGKVALVMGCGAVADGWGNGRATAVLLARQGARVFGTDLALPHAQETARLVRSEGGTCEVMACDATRSDQVADAVAQCVERFGRIDILVNNAGVTQPAKFLDITGADYDRILDVSLRGTRYASQAVLPAMLAQKSGAIVCISSVSAQRGGGILGGPHYSAAKAGVLGLARAMAREYGGSNIRVNCVTPGLIATDINKGKIPDDKRQGILDGIPLARIGEPADVAGCVVFLASDLAKYCTGVTLDVNGGMLIH